MIKYVDLKGINKDVIAYAYFSYVGPTTIDRPPDKLIAPLIYITPKYKDFSGIWRLVFIYK